MELLIVINMIMKSKNKLTKSVCFKENQVNSLSITEFLVALMQIVKISFIIKTYINLMITFIIMNLFVGLNSLCHLLVCGIVKLVNIYGKLY